MTKAIHCDGCGAELGALPLARGKKELVVSGQRADAMQGGDPLPNREFDWCESCAKIAFGAVAKARAEGATYPWNDPKYARGER